MSGGFAWIRPAAGLVLVMTLLLGLVYPLLTFALAQAVFPYQANGSLIERDGKVVGSALLGQHFDQEWYFWGRASVLSPPYNPSASGGSNLGPVNPALLEAVLGRVNALHRVDPRHAGPVPVDLVTASASGLDPHISLEAARYQLPRIAAARNIPRRELEELLAAHTHSPGFGLLAQPYVHVLELNLALWERARKKPAQ